MESCEHEIEISEQMTVQLKIPKRLTVLEFLGLTKQAEVLMKAAQKEVMLDSAPRQRRTFAKWTPEKLEKLKKVFPTSSYDELVAMPEFQEFNKSQINSKAYQIGLKKDPSAVQRQGSGNFVPFTEEEVTKIKKMHKNHKSSAAIAKSFGDTSEKFRRRIADKIQYMRKKGELK